MCVLVVCMCVRVLGRGWPTRGLRMCGHGAVWDAGDDDDSDDADDADDDAGRRYSMWCWPRTDCRAASWCRHRRRTSTQTLPWTPPTMMMSIKRVPDSRRLTRSMVPLTNSDPSPQKGQKNT